MKHGCPNKDCNYFQKTSTIVRDGSYKRKNDSRIVKRFRCSACKKRFSNATFSLAKGQKKRRVNFKLEQLLSSGVSMRRCAKILNIHRKTVRLKLIYLANKANIEHRKYLKSLEARPVEKMQFDDLITIEHTKFKPLSVSIAVDRDTRKVLGAKVSQIPAFGHLAKRARKKYGYRKSTHKAGLDSLLSTLQKTVSSNALIQTDEHKLYNSLVNKYFPGALHLQYKGGRGCVVGQGELKKLHYDPLFILNHTCATFRANINRLIRKTWCTTKDPKMLQRHLDIFLNYHNRFT